MTAVGSCEFEVGTGSFVLTGRAASQPQPDIRAPREELYFSMLDASIDEDRFVDARFRLFRLLAQVVAQDRTYQGQRECAACAAAIMAGDVSAAVRSASRLASDAFADGPRGSRFETRRPKGVNAIGKSDVRAQP